MISQRQSPTPWNKTRSSIEGFTLVELLVVLAIVGLIAALATPQVLRYLETAKINTTKTQIKNFEGALELYYLDAGRYPSTEEGLSALAKDPSNGTPWNGPYIKNEGEFLDAWNGPYQYRSPADSEPFRVVSLGRDRKAGGEGADADIGDD
jgi:general secretion pathway protein G